MIHILTVHWQEDTWVDIQLAYLHRFISKPFKVYAFLNNLPRDHREKYFYSSTEPIKEHAVKLNILADIASFNMEGPDDLLMFIDGDAFPVGDILSFAEKKLKSYPLIAVQRMDNAGDIQPHPCFCLTTLKFWKDINGDWKKGYKWNNLTGEHVTDVGGNLLEILEKKGVEWYPILRSNKRNLHPLFFGIYGDIVYHHGAGFRSPLCRHDLAKINPVIKQIYKLIPTRKLRRKIYPGWRIKEKNKILLGRVFNMIEKDKEFYRYFQQPD